MDNDAGEEEEPPPTGRWTATSSYDIYMVDTPKEGNSEDQKIQVRINLRGSCSSNFTLIRLQRIYNFLLLHAILSTVLDIIGLYYPLLYYFWD